MPAALRDALHDLSRGAGVELAGGEIIQEKQRFGALGEQVVHTHGDQIDTDRVAFAGLDRELQLGADAVRGGDDDGVGEARGREVEQGGEPADAAHPARARGRPRERLNELDQRLTGVDIDAGADRHARHGSPWLIVRPGTHLSGAARGDGTTAPCAAQPDEAMPDDVSSIRARAAPAGVVNIANVITLARLCMVPAAVWLVLRGHAIIAFALFVVAGVSDAIDGWLARRQRPDHGRRCSTRWRTRRCWSRCT